MDFFDELEYEDDPKLSQKRIQEIKDILEKEHGREFTWDEATEAFRGIELYARVIFSMYQEDCRRKELLKGNPKGFHFDRKGYCCTICQDSAFGENSWYDKYGLKCMRCQTAINEKIIPGTVATNKESWYSESELSNYFNIDCHVLKKYIKQSKIIARHLPKTKDQGQMHLCLIKDNRDILPPKKFLTGRSVRVMRKGQECYSQQHWYEYMSLKKFEQLKAKYRVFGYMRETFQRPITAGRFYAPKVNPLFLPKNAPLVEFGTENS